MNKSKKKQAVVYVLMPERLKEWLRWHWAYTPSLAFSRRVRLIIHACCSALCISHLFAFVAPLCRLYDRFSSTGREKPRFIYSHCVILWRSGVSKVSYSLISPPLRCDFCAILFCFSTPLAWNVYAPRWLSFELIRDIGWQIASYKMHGLAL